MKINFTADTVHDVYDRIWKTDTGQKEKVYET